MCVIRFSCYKSRILGEAREKGIIKPFDPDNKSPKYASYVPYWV
jgi:hypothetical protein